MGTEYERPSIPYGGPYAAVWKEGQLKTAFDTLSVDDTYDMARQYEAAVNLWEEGVETFARSINRSISEAWEGSAAEAAKTAIQNYTTDAGQLGPALKQITEYMVQSAEAVVTTKKNIPPSVHIDATSWLWPPHRFDLEQRQGQARQDAWNAYTQNYVAPLGQIDNSIPVLPTAANPTHPVDIPAATYNPSTPGVPGGVNPGDHGQNPPGTQPQQPGGQQPDNPAANQQPGATNPQSPTTTSGVTPTATTPSTTTTGTPTTPAGTVPSGVTPGDTTPGDTTPGGIPPGTTPGGPGANTPGGPGRSVPRPVGVLGAAQNPAAGRPGAGKPGMSGLPGVGGAGRGKGEGDEDGEHKTPDYLVTEENARELIGDMPLTLPGGVIGRNPSGPPPEENDRRDPESHR